MCSGALPTDRQTMQVIIIYQMMIGKKIRRLSFIATKKYMLPCIHQVFNIFQRLIQHLVQLPILLFQLLFRAAIFGVIRSCFHQLGQQIFPRQLKVRQRAQGAAKLFETPRNGGERDGWQPWGWGRQGGQLQVRQLELVRGSGQAEQGPQ